jgi:hypothetical protein
MPKVSMMPMPNLSSNARCSSGGRGAEAERQNLTRETSSPFSLRRWRVHQVGDDGRHDIDPGALVSGDHFPVTADAEAVRHHHAATVHQRGNGGHDLAIDVVQRHRAEYAVLRGEFMRGAGVFAAGADAAVGEHAAFWLAGGAGGVHQQRVVGLNDFGQCGVGQCLGIEDLRCVGIDGDDGDFTRDAGKCRFQAFGEFFAGEHDAGVGVFQHVGELRGLGQQVQRRDHEAAVHHADQQARGLVAVVQHQCDLVALAQALAEQEAREVARVALQLRISHAGAGFRRDQPGRAGLLRGAGINDVADGAHQKR